MDTENKQTIWYSTNGCCMQQVKSRNADPIQMPMMHREEIRGDRGFVSSTSLPAFKRKEKKRKTT
eukprot:1160490-Pelagomonas_calceolata.AAC.3